MRFLIILLMLLPTLISAQELKATVSVNYESLDIAYRERLRNFAREVEAYLNTNRFTTASWHEEDKIDCQFTIFFTSAGSEVNYGAQVVITSQRPVFKVVGNDAIKTDEKSLVLKIQDKNWTFKYEKGQTFYFNQTEFDPLTSFLDFYACIIIGFDSETYDKLGGSELFTRAYETAVLGANSQLFSEGWSLESSGYNKRALVQDLADEKFQRFREDITDYYFNGIDLMRTDKKFAQDNMAKLVYNLFEKLKQMNRRSALLKVFFDAKAREIAEYMDDYRDIKVFEKLKIIDPAHISIYDEVIDKR
ncbi:MAG: DUF4835 family protein [Ignavibacteria bacterium]|jgi:hypothetical protein